MGNCFKRTSRELFHLLMKILEIREHKSSPIENAQEYINLFSSTRKQSDASNLNIPEYLINIFHNLSAIIFLCNLLIYFKITLLCVCRVMMEKI